MKRPFGEPSEMFIISDDKYGVEYLNKYFSLDGGLSPQFDENHKLVGIWFSDNLRPKKKFRNKKNGKAYVVENEEVINCTNAQDSQVMYLYYCEQEPMVKYVRRVEEFKEKFEEIRMEEAL